MAKYLVTTLKQAIKEIDPKVWFGITYNDGGTFSRSIKTYIATNEKNLAVGINNATLLKATLIAATRTWHHQNGLPLASVDVELHPTHDRRGNSYKIVIRIKSKDKEGNVVQTVPPIFTEDEREHIIHALGFVDDDEGLSASITQKLFEMAR